jgi:type II secretory pathway pseudopilin PulG
MSAEWIAVLTIGGTLLLVLTSLLNFSVFVRQLRASREQLETARRQLENARVQPEILLSYCRLSSILRQLTRRQQPVQGS